MLPEKYNNALNFIQEGKGETTLVFLHYFGGSSKSWSAVIDVLKNFFHCVAIDLRGFGESQVLETQISLHHNAEDVLELIQLLKLKNYVLIGHSMGGKIVLSIASQKPPGLSSLILIAPSPPTPEPSNHEDRIELIIAFRERSAIEKLIRKITAKPLADDVFEQTVQDHLRVSQTAWNGWIEKGSREDISSLMSNINIPGLIISGESDPNFSTIFLRKEFIKYFPSACFEETQHAGHLIPIEAPLEVAMSIQKFLKRL